MSSVYTLDYMRGILKYLNFEEEYIYTLSYLEAMNVIRQIERTIPEINIENTSFPSAAPTFSPPRSIYSPYKLDELDLNNKFKNLPLSPYPITPKTIKKRHFMLRK